MRLQNAARAGRRRRRRLVNLTQIPAAAGLRRTMRSQWAAAAEAYYVPVTMIKLMIALAVTRTCE